MSTASVASIQAFYISEGGLEDGRDAIFQMNKVSPDPRDLSEELAALSGGDDVLDFTPQNVRPVFDGNGNLTGFTGYDDDVPLRNMISLSDGRYATFVNNDPVESIDSVTDNNDMLLLTTIAVREDHSMEMVRALVERPDTFAIPPATITILGPSAIFDGGSSNAKELCRRRLRIPLPAGHVRQRPGGRRDGYGLQELGRHRCRQGG